MTTVPAWTRARDALRLSASTGLVLRHPQGLVDLVPSTPSTVLLPQPAHVASRFDNAAKNSPVHLLARHPTCVRHSFMPVLRLVQPKAFVPVSCECDVAKIPPDPNLDDKIFFDKSRHFDPGTTTSPILPCTPCVVAAFVRVLGIPLTRSKTGDPARTAKISYPDATSTSATTTSPT